MLPSRVERAFQSNNILIPKDYLRSPIFAACKQSTGRIVVIQNEDRIYEIGGFIPFNDPEDTTIYPAFDLKHLKAILVILSFQNDSVNVNQSKVRFSLTQFCNRYSKSENSKGGKCLKAVRRVLRELVNCWFRITYPNLDQITYRILDRLSIHSKVKKNKIQETQEIESLQREYWLDHVELNPEFEKLLKNYAELGQINLDVFTSLTSPLAQCLYTYMPSRAIYRHGGNPFPISLSHLLKEVGYEEKAIPQHKSLRKKIFTQNKHSVIKQLDGLPFINGVLRVKLAETEDSSDYKLLFWNEHAKRPNELKIRSSCPKLRKYWLESGRTNREFNERIHKNLKLQFYQEELLERAAVQLKGNEMFMQRALSLLGESKFDEVLSEVKSMVLEPDTTVIDPTKLFISLVCKELTTPA